MRREQLELVVNEMIELERQYKNCRIEFNPELKLIEIIKELPKDFYEIGKIKIINKH